MVQPPAFPPQLFVQSKDVGQNFMYSGALQVVVARLLQTSSRLLVVFGGGSATSVQVLMFVPLLSQMSWLLTQHIIVLLTQQMFCLQPRLLRWC